MRVMLAPNSFKESLDAFAVADAIATGLARSAGNFETVAVPVADGGDFTAAVLLRGVGGRWVETDVVDALGRKLRAKWGVLDDGTTAIIEAASAAGLASLKPLERNPMIAS